MELNFYKYQGAGNDFILVDNRDKKYSNLTHQQIALLCDRRFGIGADGFMMLESHGEHPFCMVFFNSDGLPGSMCGNGGRCICAFALKLGMVKPGEEFSFWSSDGVHKATILSGHGQQHIVRLKMRDVNVYAHQKNHIYLIDSGSPHYISFVTDCDKVDVDKEGSIIRFSRDFPHGINVNFVEELSDSNCIKVRTYERGVEQETFSCGTGATACAMAQALRHHFEPGHHSISISARGGNLRVDYLMNILPAGLGHIKTQNNIPLPMYFEEESSVLFSEVHLEGLATFVFSGTLEIND